LLRALLTALGISADEWPFVRSLAGLFLVGSAAATLTASAAKAMFLTANPLSTLPYVLMAQALWGLSIALVYTQATARYDVTRRFMALVLASVASFAGLWSLFGWNPRIASMIAAVWAPGLVQLVVLQTWSLPTTFLPGRTTKRLIPVLAAVATFGAAAGGGLTRVIGAVIETEDLLLLSAALLGGLGLFVPGVVRGLRALSPPESAKSQRAVPSLRSSMLDVIHSPLLSRLALVVFVTQFVSVLVDYQFSGELKARYDKEQLGSFLGTFYWVGNLLVLGVSLLATQRLVRWLGLGLCISGVAMLVGAGSAAYLAGALTAAFPAFYALVGTSTAERVGQFALSRNAAQMLLAPLDSQAVERARTLIDGVVYRGASLAASAALVFAAAVPLWGLAVPVIVGCVLVIAVALTIEPHYRKALFDALGTGRLQAGGAAGRVVLDASAEQEIVRALASDDDAEIVRGLALVRALGAAPDLARVEALAARGTEPVSPAALETLEALNIPLSPELAERLLGPQRPVAVLRAALAALGPTETPAVTEAIAGLRDHADATVSTLARVTAPPPSLGPEPAQEWRSGGAELVSLLENADLHTRRDLVKLLGQGAVDSSLPPLLRALEDHRMRDETIEALSRFGVRLVPAAAAALAENTLSETAQVALLHAVLRVREPEARDLLMRASALRNTALRNAAARGLWRLGAEDRLRPDPEWLVEAARREIDLLTALMAAATRMSAAGRDGFLRSELVEQTAMAERRVFGLLGLLYGRAELHRAQCHLHSQNPRSRSNAIELLDQKLKHAALRPFIDLVEGRASRAPTGPAALSTVSACPTVLLRMEKWLGGEADDRLERAHQLRQADLFGDASAEAVAALAEDVRVELLPAGAQTEVGEGIIVLLSGAGTLEPPDRDLVPGDVAGALECLAGEPAATARFTARTATMVALMPVEALEAHLTNHPALVRALLRRLGGRLRVLNRKAA
jgi:ATP/ADP translocase